MNLGICLLEKSVWSASWSRSEANRMPHTEMKHTVAGIRWRWKHSWGCDLHLYRFGSSDSGVSLRCRNIERVEPTHERVHSAGHCGRGSTWSLWDRANLSECRMGNRQTEWPQLERNSCCIAKPPCCPNLILMGEDVRKSSSYSSRKGFPSRT